MAKYVIAKNGVVINIVNAPASSDAVEYAWLVPDNQVVNVGDAFDPKDYQVDAGDVVAMKGLFNHENRLRQLTRALRASSAAANTAANNAGLPTAANSADLTADQFRTLAKTLLP